MKQLLYLLLPLWCQAQPVPPPTLFPEPEAALQHYQNTLKSWRQDYRNHEQLPDLHFFTFGMGNRTKYIYRSGRLLNALTGNIEEQWTIKKEIIVPSEYLVHLITDKKDTVQIREDETGVWVLQSGKRVRRVADTRTRLNLPRFDEYRLGSLLRVLHQEVLINIRKGANGQAQPVLNFLLYQKPVYLNAALMAMVLRETGNLSLIQDWIMAIRDPFDRHNHGLAEADNLGEVLFLVSLVADKAHPVVATVLDSAGRFRHENYIAGLTDEVTHPVFQTKWLKFGLKSLALPDAYGIPNVPDSYSSLFWPDFTLKAQFDSLENTGSAHNQPAMRWAEEHFAGRSGKLAKRGLVSDIDYPLSWDKADRNAHYPALTVLDPALVKQKITFPYARSASELFLLLIEQLPK